MDNEKCTNSFINDLDFYDREKLLNICEQVELSEKELLNAPNQNITNFYFPNGAVIAMMLANKTDKTLELGLIGEEGFLGIEPILGVYKAPYKAIVHTKGLALKTNVAQLLKLISTNDAIKAHLFLYIAVTNHQLAQSAVCNRFHLVEQRLAKLLLMLQSRLHSSQFKITQDLLAAMLGVRRVGVTKSARLFQHLEIVHYSRGNLMILDLKALEKVACNCFAIDQFTYQSIMYA
jgi:CRP-like cAMP-binding protein